MKKSFALIGFSWFLAGCVSAPAKPYVPKTGSDIWNISGKYSPATHAIQVLFNKKTVLDGRISFLFGNSAKMSGEYKGHKVDADCAITKGILRDTLFCVVSVDNETATKLDFDYY